MQRKLVEWSYLESFEPYRMLYISRYPSLGASSTLDVALAISLKSMPSLSRTYSEYQSYPPTSDLHFVPSFPDLPSEATLVSALPAPARAVARRISGQRYGQAMVRPDVEVLLNGHGNGNGSAVGNGHGNGTASEGGEGEKKKKVEGAQVEKTGLVGEKEPVLWNQGKEGEKDEKENYDIDGESRSAIDHR